MSEIRLYFKSSTIRDDADFLCLTDMWRAAGDDAKKRPSDWLALDSVQEFRSYLETTLSEGSLTRATEGRSGATWAHWQLGMAYAKYLSHEFHAWCNDVVRKVMAQAATSVDNTALVAFAATLGAAVDQLTKVSSRLKKIEDNQAALWSHVSMGGYIARARFDALWEERKQVADLEVAAGKWPQRRAALGDITREMRDSTDWGRKGEKWQDLPAALEPAVRAVLNRRRKDAMRALPPARQLSLVKTA